MDKLKVCDGCKLFNACLKIDHKPPCAYEVKESLPTDNQQLKAEIAALADKVDNDGFGATYDFSIISLVDALRQLSAV